MKTLVFGRMAPVRLRCEYLVNPIGLETARPRLFWQMKDPRIGARQTAWQVQVATTAEKLISGRPDLWDSGRIADARSAQVEYEGATLAGGERAFWRVRIWNATGERSSWSEAAFWEMGLLLPGDWAGAKWIGLETADPSISFPCPFLRRSFHLPATPVRARLAVSARGLYQCSLNGEKVGDGAVFTPGWTEYEVRIPYQVYDVTAQLQAGENVLGAILGDGWFRGNLINTRNIWGEQISLLARLRIELPGGAVQTLVSDDSWQAKTGPILASDIYNGETYDARLEMPGWNTAKTAQAEGWKPVSVYAPPEAALSARVGPRVRPIMELKPKKITEPAPGTWIFHFGQNMVGWVRLKLQGRKGQKIRLRFGERLQDDGTLYTANLRTAEATDYYVFGADGEAEYEPTFTFHGFEYVELTGCDAPPDLSAVQGIVLHSEMDETGTFFCSHPLLNRLQRNIAWGQRGNFLEVPTDCPQRNERLGWTGDAQVFIRTACFNFDTAAFFTKWLVDLCDAQDATGAFPDVAPNAGCGKGHAAWADAGVICPWTLYTCYGDRRVLERHYTSMARWLDFMEKTADNLIRPDDGYGDWLALAAQPTPKPLIGTAYFAHCADLMQRIAGILGRDADAAHYAEQATAVRAAFNREFVATDGTVGTGTQTGYLLALAFDLLSEDKRGAAAAFLVQALEAANWHLTTGFVGTPLLAPVLTRIGRDDIAWRLVLQKTYPSWFYPILNGATTMWERWNSWTREDGFGDVGMNSFNHYAYGAIGEWLYARGVGLDLDPDQPGYRHLLIHPAPCAELTQAAAALHTLYGEASVCWRRRNGRLTLEVRIPPNTEASATLPTNDPAAIRVNETPVETAAGVTGVNMLNDKVVMELASGFYYLELTDPCV